ncbi:toxin-antitoxin system YwqK family antitoxin [Vibrio bathopelagicus]|uniref:toxin-antitoxin system YwqK family antitoxin n=1 Tax=Vibrio bathopelagicus TaxID=2777577 RepID=UPI001865590B|nr:toxin-antitoxin system YwqK family antitoxin [Vibrio bathopelagicus]
MKKYIPILIALSTMSSMSYAASPREDAVDYLQMRKGVAYQVNHSKPFTGQFEEKFDNGQVATQAQFSDGLELGQETNWYPNGQVASKVNYVKGELQGKAETWYPNGQKKAELNYKDNELSGVASRWYPNGEQSLTAEYSDGQKDGLVTDYYPNGNKASQAKFNEGEMANGKLTRWNLNGDKVEELTFKDHKITSKQVWMPTES